MDGTRPESVIVGNVFDKYRTANPLARLLMHGFLRAVTALYRRVGPSTVLEVGCGEGLLAHHLVTHAPRPARFVASDTDLGPVAPALDPLLEWQVASVYALPFEEGAFDLVVCCEVLEHLEDPRRGLAEVARVARRAVLLSTPREPLWRVLNVLRGHYWRRGGNTPGHVQHFSATGLERLAAPSLRILERRRPPPWTVLLGAPRRADMRAVDGGGAGHPPMSPPERNDRDGR